MPTPDEIVADYHLTLAQVLCGACLLLHRSYAVEGSTARCVRVFLGQLRKKSFEKLAGFAQFLGMDRAFQPASKPY
jgi:hypothetical protein